MSEPNDPAESHHPKDDGDFLHVVIYAGIFLVMGLAAAFIILKVMGKHVVPSIPKPHPTSLIALPAVNAHSKPVENASESPFILTQQKTRARV